MTRLITFFLALLVLFPSSASAQDANVQKLTTLFQNILDYQKNVNEAFGSTSLTYEGDLAVVKEANHYTITLPRILISSSSQLKDITPQSNGVFNTGIIKINATPSEKAGLWNTIWTFPSEMRLVDPGQEDFVVTLGDQKTLAVLDEKLGYFTRVNANLSDVRFLQGEKDSGVTLGNVKFYVDLKEGENGTYSGPTNIALDNLVIAPHDEEGFVKIGSLNLEGNIDGIVLPTLQEYEAKILKHASTFSKLGTTKPDSVQPAVEPQQVTSMISDLYDFNVSGVDFQYNVKDLEIQADSAKETRIVDSLKLASGFFGIGFNGLNAESGGFNVRFGFDDAVAALEGQEQQELLSPKSMDFNLKAENIPYPMLTKLGENAIQSVTSNPASAQMVGLGLMMKLPAILSQSGTKLTLEKHGIKSNVYDVSVDGSVVADLTAIMGFTAKFNAMFKGLEKVMKIAKANPEHAKTVKSLEQAKSLGKNEGNDTYTYVFEATPDGQFLINGQNASTVMNATPPPSPVAPQ